MNRITVVIPVFGDHRALESLLGSLTLMMHEADRIIVVDGADSSDCKAVVSAHDAVYLPARPGRGAQLDAGAGLAESGILWFVHADATPAHDATRQIRQAIDAGAIGGWFRFRFSGPRGAGQRVLETLINWRTRFGIPYGDQGLFMTVDAYRRAGGFPDLPLFEEVALVRNLRRLGPFRPLNANIGVSPRRWERDGWLRRSLHNRLLALGYSIGISPGTLARQYRPMQKPQGQDPC